MCAWRIAFERNELRHLIFGMLFTLIPSKVKVVDQSSQSQDENVYFSAMKMRVEFETVNKQRPASCFLSSSLC